MENRCDYVNFVGIRNERWEGSVVAPEKPEAELKRLLKEQNKARQDEVFGGFSPAERAEYEGKKDRIHALESEIQASAGSKKSSMSAKAEQERQWNKEPETDTPQAEAHQPYRSREKGSTDCSSDSRRTRATPKNTEEKGGE
jgi:hypothetical protein